MNDKPERMGKRLLECCWGQPKKWVREKAKTISFWLVSLALLVLLLSLWVMFDDMIRYDGKWIYDSLGVTEKAAALKTLGFVIAGIGAFLGVVVANRRAKAADDTAKAADDTAKAAEAGNRQRAFKDGVEHLGRGEASVRQGGAHALFHLALKDEGLRASIAGVLCAHIRETTGDKDYQEQNKDKPSTEMQSLLRLLFTTETVGEKELEKFWQGSTPDLSGGYFRGVELESARFQSAKLNSAQFQGALLDKAQFQEASLVRAQFQGALLTESQFQKASLGRVQFQRALLTGAQFQGALIWEAQFQGASLFGVQFQRARLLGSQFQGALMLRTRLHAANLSGTQFQGADLTQAEFQGTRLFGSQFQGASLSMTGFQQAQFNLRSGHDGIPAQDQAVAKPGEPAEKLKVSAFHGVSFELHARESFDERINDRTGKASDLSGAIFAGGVTEELLAEVKEALEFPVNRMLPHLDVFSDSDAEGKFVRDLESEIGQPESHTPPKEVIAGSYGKEDAERWIREFREAMETVPETN